MQYVPQDAYANIEEIMSCCEVFLYYPLCLYLTCELASCDSSIVFVRGQTAIDLIDTEYGLNMTMCFTNNRDSATACKPFSDWELNVFESRQQPTVYLQHTALQNTAMVRADFKPLYNHTWNLMDTEHAASYILDIFADDDGNGDDGIRHTYTWDMRHIRLRHVWRLLLACATFHIFSNVSFVTFNVANCATSWLLRIYTCGTTSLIAGMYTPMYESFL